MRITFTGYQEVEADSKPLPDKKCDFVVLTASPLTLSDARIAPDANGTYLTTGKEVLWGFGAEAMHTLYVGQTSLMIPVENLSDLVVKAINPSAGQVVIFSCFSETKEQFL